MNRRNFPTITKKVVTDQLVARTNLDKVAVNKVMTAYYDIIQETLLSGVEFQMPNIGILSFRDMKPVPAGERWHPALKQRIYMLPRQGYYKLQIKPNRDFQKMLKRKTAYGTEATEEERREWVKAVYGDDAEYWTRYRYKENEEKK